jgi:voltage-dependent potassium channel beta subunit
MEYRRLGRSGLQVSSLSLGSWLTFGAQIDDQTAQQLMHTAYDAGVNFFDNAEIYAEGRSEVVMGKILKNSGWDRSSFVVSSKVFFGDHRQGINQRGLSRKHIVEACEAALKRLQVDYLDLFFCHRPDPNTPIEETVWAMHHLIQQGKILYWGTSEWSAQEITAAHAAAMRYNLIAPVMEQPQYNMFHRYRVEVEYARIFEDYGMGTTIWSPLASGVLTGKYNTELPTDGTRLTDAKLAWLKEKSVTPERLQKAIAITHLADEIGTSAPKLAIAWCLKNPHISTVILGASKVHQLEETLQSIDTIPLLTDEVMGKIEVILENKPKRMIW